METPKFIKCPECHSKYDDTKKRRIIDSCGHPRCYSCLFVNNPCLVCEKLLRGRSKSWLSSRESLLSTDEDQDTGKCNRVSNGFLSKEHYLRTLYSYDPGSQENLYHAKGLSYRRGSLDIPQTENRRIMLGRHSVSAFALTTISQNSGLFPSSSKESISENGTARSSPFPSKKFLISSELSASTQSLSSSPGMTKRMFDDIMENDVMQHQVTSPRSSGYWSEMESYSDHETEKTTSSKQGGNNSRNTCNKSMRKLAIIDGVLTGTSFAWENTKALFQPSSPDVLKSESGKRNDTQERRHSAPEWHFKKFLDNQKKHTYVKKVKVTDL